MHETQPETLRQQQVFAKVKQLYQESTRPVAHWMWHNHVQIVAQKAAELADRFNINKEQAVVGALLHDLADVWLSRKDENYDAIEERESRIILTESGFGPEEIDYILDEVVAPHSCHPGNVPTEGPGKALATADALAHLTTNFYKDVESQGLDFWQMTLPSGGYPAWARKKLDRDLNDKIFWDEVHQEAQPFYDHLVAKYSP